MQNTQKGTISGLKNHCNVCNKTIRGGKYKYNCHMYQHNLLKPKYKCTYCWRQYFRKDLFIKHVNAHTGNQKTFICDYCDREFVDKRNLISHLRIHDDTIELSKKRYNQYACIACGMHYCEERLLKYHIRKEHFNLQMKDQAINEQQPVNSTWVEKVLETDICVEMTKVNNNVITIKKCDKTQSTVKTEKTKDMDHFQDYMQSVFAHRDKSQYSKAVCDYCNKEMLKKSLQNHIRERHLQLRRFKCDTCQEMFMRHYQLINHRCGHYKKRQHKKNKK